MRPECGLALVRAGLRAEQQEFVRTTMVHLFGAAATTAERAKELLGGKGSNLAEMASIGLPVPPGFTITTEVCTAYYDNGEQFPAGLVEEVTSGIAHIEGITGDRKSTRLNSSH